MDINHPTGWYKAKREDIYNHGGQKSLEQYYGNSVIKVFVVFASDTVGIIAVVS